MDGNLGQRMQSLEDMQKTLDIVEFLQERRVSLLARVAGFTLG